MDVNWLQVEDGSETVHCDHCGADFTLPGAAAAPARSQTAPADEAPPPPVTARSGSWR